MTPADRTFDIALRADWSADNTTVTLYADDRPSDGASSPAEAAAKALPFGTADAPAGKLVIDPKIRGADGSRLRGYVALPVYTVEKIKLVDVQFGERKDLPGSYNRAYTDTSDNGQLAAGGTVTLTFSKPVAPGAQFVLFKAIYTTTTAYTWSPTPTPITKFNISGNTVDIWLDDAALGSALYAIGYTVSSTGVNDSIARLSSPGTATTGTDVVSFVSKDTVILTGVNLYSSDTNVYNVANVAADNLKSFPVTSAIELTFEGEEAFEAGNVQAELYTYSSVGTITYNDADKATKLKRASIPLDAFTVTSAAGETTLSIKPTTKLAFNTRYALALRIVSADGYTIFNSQSPAFAYYYGAGTDTVISTNSSQLVYVAKPQGANGDLYFAFWTENDSTNVIGIDSYGSRSNIKLGTAYVYPAGADPAEPGTYTDDFDPEDPIILSFKEGVILDSTKTSVNFYVWNDETTGEVGDVDADLSELAPSQATFEVSGNKVTITPAGILAPGESFAIRLVTESTDGKKAIYDSAQAGVVTGAQKHLRFKVKAIDVDRVYNLVTTNPAVIPIASFGLQSSSGSIESNSTSVPLVWTSLNTTAPSLYYGEDIYTFYTREDIFGWQKVTTPVAEVARSYGLGREVPVTATVAVPTIGGNSPFEIGGSVDILVTGINDYGFFAASDVFTGVSDNTAPVLVSTNPTDLGSFAPTQEGSVLTNYVGVYTLGTGPNAGDEVEIDVAAVSAESLTVSFGNKTGGATGTGSPTTQAIPVDGGGYTIKLTFPSNFSGSAGTIVVNVFDRAGNRATATAGAIPPDGRLNSIRIEW